MYKAISAAAIAAAVLFAVPHAASALPGQGTAIKSDSNVTDIGYRKHNRYYKNRNWRSGKANHGHRYYRKRKGIHIHVN
ncbi:MAG: hypothetical protein WDN31_14110 [Hyphomicrobium sp.]